jgi:hypothetical protein
MPCKKSQYSRNDRNLITQEDVGDSNAFFKFQIGPQVRFDVCQESIRSLVS